MEASNLGTLSKCIIILLHAVRDCPGGKTAAISLCSNYLFLLYAYDVCVQ